MLESTPLTSRLEEHPPWTIHGSGNRKILEAGGKRLKAAKLFQDNVWQLIFRPKNTESAYDHELIVKKPRASPWRSDVGAVFIEAKFTDSKGISRQIRYATTFAGMPVQGVPTSHLNDLRLKDMGRYYFYLGDDMLNANSVKYSPDPTLMWMFSYKYNTVMWMNSNSLALKPISDCIHPHSLFQLAYASSNRAEGFLLLNKKYNKYVGDNSTQQLSLKNDKASGTKFLLKKDPKHGATFQVMRQRYQSKHWYARTAATIYTTGTTDAIADYWQPFAIISNPNAELKLKYHE